MSTDENDILPDLHSVRRDVNLTFYELTYSGSIGRDRAAGADSRTGKQNMGCDRGRRRA